MFSTAEDAARPTEGRTAGLNLNPGGRHRYHKGDVFHHKDAEVAEEQAFLPYRLGEDNMFLAYVMFFLPSSALFLLSFEYRKTLHLKKTNGRAN